MCGRTPIIAQNRRREAALLQELQELHQDIARQAAAVVAATDTARLAVMGALGLAACLKYPNATWQVVVAAAWSALADHQCAVSHCGGVHVLSGRCMTGGATAARFPAVQASLASNGRYRCGCLSGCLLM